MRLARTRNIPVVADMEHVGGEVIEELVRQTDHLIVGTEFAEAMTKETEPERMVRVLAGTERACSVVTAGDRGCWYSVRGGAVRHFPAFQVHTRRA